MRFPSAEAPQLPALLATLASAGTLALFGWSASAGLIQLPEYIGPQGFGHIAKLYAVAGSVALSISIPLRLGRVGFCMASAAIAVLCFALFFLVFGTILVTEEELAVHARIFWFFASCIGVCSLSTWGFLLLTAELSKVLRRVA